MSFDTSITRSLMQIDTFVVENRDLTSFHKKRYLCYNLSIAADDESCWKSETKEMKAIRKLYSKDNTIEKNTAFNIYNTLVAFLSSENNYREYGVEDVVYNKI